MQESKKEAIAKLKEMLEDIDFSMLTTMSGDILKSRPMSTQEVDEEGNIWFFTSDNTHKVEEIEKDNRVNVAYSEPSKNTYVSVAGTAELVKDRAKIEELWKPILKAWFPKGLDDPTLALLKISIDEAEYWDSPSSSLVQIAGFVKALVTGKQIDAGDHGKVSL